MYFKDFPSFLYDFNYGNGVIKTDIVKDITRNIRFKSEILKNVSVYDEYDMIDGETPEIISEKFYGTPEYHWVIMLANDKFDWLRDFPLTETVLQKHITSVYNPVLKSSNWKFVEETDGSHTLVLTIYNNARPFDLAYLTSPVTYTVYGETTAGKFSMYFSWSAALGGLVLDPSTQTFYQALPNGIPAGEPVGELTITTTGRENNPIYFLNEKGLTVNATEFGSVPVTGSEVHRLENDMKRKIKIISPSLLEMLIKNYEELL